MKLAGQYIRLREHLSHIKESETMTITVDELAAILCCTHRNVLLILKRMSAKAWLTWKPKRGRGNRSELQFHIPAEQLVLDQAKSLVKKKDVKGALEQINVSSVPSAIKTQFNQWLYSYFGYRSEVKDRKTIDTLRLPLSGPLISLDPVHTNFAIESHLIKQIFDNLVKYNAMTHTIEPHLAHYWEVDDSRTVWMFYLRKGVWFHHGRQMDAEDVVFSLNRPRFLRESTLYRWVLEQIEHIEAINATTIRVRLRQPNELFLPFLSTTKAAIVPKDICEATPDQLNKAPIGTGPFRLVNLDRSICALEAFPYYFQGRAHLDRVEIWNIPELYDTEDDQKLENFQVIHNVKMLNPEKETKNQIKSSGTTCKFLTFNQLKAQTTGNERLRKALIEIINPEQLVEHLEAHSLIPTEGFLSQEKLKAKRLTRSEQKQRLKDANYQGEILEICTIPHYERDALLVQKLCSSLDINIKITLLSPDEFKSDKRLKADIILFALMLDHDHELRLIDLYKSMQKHLQREISGQLDKYIQSILSETVPSERTVLLQETEAFLKNKRVIHFLYKKQLQTAFHPTVKGISLDSLGWVQFKDIWYTQLP
jgi:SgrR family transcriptional regulator